MQHRIVPALVTIILGACVGACETSGTPAGSGSPSGSSGTAAASGAASSGTASGSASGSGATSGATSGASSGASSGLPPADAGCAAGAGMMVPAKWDFAASKASLNGGKGQVLTVHVCDTVVWTNDDNGVPHAVVSTGGGFSFTTPTVTGTAAGVILGQVQFPMAGTFTYQCGVHTTMMIGQITVQ